MIPRLFAFDLDGTLLNDDKKISAANLHALREMASQGAAIVFASGRLGSSIVKFAPPEMDDLALLTLNGAAVYTGRRRGARKIVDIPLASTMADALVEYGRGKPFALNYYIDDKLYTVRDGLTAPWNDLYFKETGTECHFEPSLDRFRGRSPSKIIFVGDPAIIDAEEKAFRDRGSNDVYICRSWDHYLEFLNPAVNKAAGLEALFDTYGVGWHEIAAFGDAENDVPMLMKAGVGIALANATEQVKRIATYVSPWTNNQDGIAREWERMMKIADCGLQRKFQTAFVINMLKINELRVFLHENCSH